MTPKEKAKELLNKFNFETKQSEIINDIILGDISVKFKEHQLKKCALIAVDEIIKSNYKLLSGVKPSFYDYWQQVKDEILNL